jgi:hypothetical protein
MNRTSTEIETGKIANQQSSIAKPMATLSPSTLRWILAAMCITPVAIILALFQYMPPVYEGLLEAKITATGLPPKVYYEEKYYERLGHEGGQLLIENQSDQDWTHLNIQVNKHYQIIDKVPIKARSVKAFDLDRFVNRTGARFSVQYNELASARIYARRPTRDRATYACEFVDGQPVEIEETLKARARAKKKESESEAR